MYIKSFHTEKTLLLKFSKNLAKYRSQNFANYQNNYQNNYYNYVGRSS